MVPKSDPFGEPKAEPKAEEKTEEVSDSEEGEDALAYFERLANEN